MVQLINGFEWGREKKTSAYIRINVSNDFSNEFCLRYFEQRWIYIQNNTSRMSDANDFISFSTRFSFVMRFVFIHSCNITTKRHGKIKIKIPIESRWQYYVAYDQCYRPVHALFYLFILSVFHRILNFSILIGHLFGVFRRCALACSLARDHKPNHREYLVFSSSFFILSFGFWILILSCIWIALSLSAFRMFELNETRGVVHC